MTWGLAKMLLGEGLGSWNEVLRREEEGRKISGGHVMPRLLAALTKNYPVVVDLILIGLACTLQRARMRRS